MMRIIATIALLASAASAETLHKGRVYRTTADDIITRERMVCIYGPWRFETADNGATILRRAKHCEKQSGRR